MHQFPEGADSGQQLSVVRLVSCTGGHEYLNLRGEKVIEQVASDKLTKRRPGADLITFTVGDLARPAGSKTPQNRRQHRKEQWAGRCPQKSINFLPPLFVISKPKGPTQVPAKMLT